LFAEMMQKRGWSADTIRAYERGLTLFTRWLLKSTTIESLASVTPETIAAWREELETWGVAESTKKLRLVAVKTFFAMICEAGAIDVDPAAAIEIPKRRSLPARRPVPTAKQVETMIESAPAGSRDATIIEVLYGAGLRGCELRALNIEDIDLDARIVRVRRGKGGKTRVVPIGAAAVAALRAFIGERRDGRLFVISARSLRRVVARAARRIGARFSPHRLRHAFATHLLQRGAQLDEVRQLLGHAWLDTTQLYVHVEPRDLGDVHARFHPRG
jgi:site-specific recombinase XerD